SRAQPNMPSSCKPCRAISQNALLPRVGSCPCRKPREPSDIIPRCRSLVPPCATQNREKWTTFTPPAAGLSRRYRGRLSHRRSQHPPVRAVEKTGGVTLDLGGNCFDFSNVLLNDPEAHLHLADIAELGRDPAAFDGCLRRQRRESVRQPGEQNA